MKNSQEQIFEQINKAKNILITASAKWNEEVIACSLALQNILQKMDKKSEIVLQLQSNEKFLQPTTEIFSILPGFDNIKTKYQSNNFVITLKTDKAKIEKIRYKSENNNLNFFITPESGTFTKEDVQVSTNHEYDLIIVLGTSDLELLDELYDNSVNLFYKTPIINIDNKAHNDEFGQINLIDLLSLSVSEIIFSLFKKQDQSLIDKNIAECLLAGIIYATKNFKSNINPQALTTTSELISLGANKDKIITKFYRSFSINNLKLWGKAFNNFKRHKNIKNLAWTTVYENDFIETDTKKDDLINLFDEININLTKVKITIIFYEIKIKNKPYSNALIYHDKNINLQNTVVEYENDYNNSIFQIHSNKPIDSFKKNIIKKFSLLLEKENN